MKQTFLVVTCLMLVVTTLASPTGKTNGDEVNIPIYQQDGPSSGRPRTPINNPFFAVLLRESGYVLLGVTTPCGIVSVQITSTVGDDYSTNFNTVIDSILLPISENPGYYTLLITTGDGIQFIGEFTI